ncbi:hypothetical protein BC829DRAFT_381029, partial [Chytridium lagenaria]
MSVFILFVGCFYCMVCLFSPSYMWFFCGVISILFLIFPFLHDFQLYFFFGGGHPFHFPFLFFFFSVLFCLFSYYITPFFTCSVSTVFFFLSSLHIV